MGHKQMDKQPLISTVLLTVVMYHMLQQICVTTNTGW